MSKDSLKNQLFLCSPFPFSIGTGLLYVFKASDTTSLNDKVLYLEEAMTYFNLAITNADWYYLKNPSKEYYVRQQWLIDLVTMNKDTTTYHHDPICNSVLSIIYQLRDDIDDLKLHDLIYTVIAVIDRCTTILMKGETLT